MNWRNILPNAVQYAIAAFICWLLISQQISDSVFLGLFLIYGLSRYLFRKREKS